MHILIATGNQGKIREYETLLADTPVTLLSLNDVGLEWLVVDETASTFAGNAQIKALAYSQASGHLTLADDSGLCVDALDGAPGVYSARYGGSGLDDAGRRHKLLEALDGVVDEERSAHFTCVIALADPRMDDCILAEGRCDGFITYEEYDGGHGFGYDPVFLPAGYDRTFAQLPKAEKNHISHRGRAVQKLVPLIKELAL